jgi:hypothetical protein
VRFSLQSLVGWTSPKANEMFQAVAKFEAERRTRTRQGVSDGLRRVPASQKVLGAVVALPPEDHMECGYEDHSLRDSV